MKSLKLCVSTLLISILFSTSICPITAKATATIRCESQNFRYTECGSNISQAWVAKQLSSSPCRQGSSYGVSEGHIWVKEGCRADFGVEYLARELSVSVKGNGNGMINSNPSGINCDASWYPAGASPCSESYFLGTRVTLEAQPFSGSFFTGWSGDCSGTGNCSVYMSQDKTITATFSKASLQPVLNVLLNGGPKIIRTRDAYGNVVKLISNEENANGRVITTLTKNSEGKVEASVDFNASGKTIQLQFYATDPSVLESGKSNYRVSLTKSSNGHILDIPKKIMSSWATSDVQVSNNGKEVPISKVEVLDDDPRLNFVSTLFPIGDYVFPVNLITYQTGNSAIEADRPFFNNFDGKIILKYQIKYHANYTIFSSEQRNISVNAGMGNSHFTYNSDLIPKQSRPRTFSTNKTSQHTSGVDYYIGPSGWFAHDSKTGNFIDGYNKNNIGFFEFEWDPASYGFVWDGDARFFASITLDDGSGDERYEGNLLWSYVLPFADPTFKMTSPSKVSTFVVGEKVTVSWETCYWKSDKQLALYYVPVSGNVVPNENQYILIDTFSANSNNLYGTGSYDWIVPNTPGDSWKLVLKLITSTQWKTPNVLSPQFSIVSPPDTCDFNHLNLCNSSGTCSGAGGYWYNSRCNTAPAPSSCDASHLSLCTTSSTCTDVGGYWYNNACNSTPESYSCDNNHLNLCGSENVCSNAGGYWYSETQNWYDTYCHSTPDPTATCDANHLSLCSTYGACLAAGGYMYDGVCHNTPEDTTSCDSAHLSLCVSTDSCSSAGGYWWWTDNACHSTTEESGAGTVTYKGKTWQQDDDGKPYTWEAAKYYCASLPLDGGGWRLPSKSELMSLVVCTNGTSTPLQDYPDSPYKCEDGNNTSYDRPTIDGIFTSISFVYWTSTSYSETNKWAVTFYDGSASTQFHTNGCYVRCVR